MSAHPSTPQFARANRLDGIELSIIVRIQERAAELRAQGMDIIGLGTGEPDFDTPEHIKDAATAAMKAGLTKYPPTAGTTALRQAVADKFKRENELDYLPSEVMVSTGAKQVLFNAFMATLNPGDEVILPAPHWGVYTDIVKLCGGIPKGIACGPQTRFLLDAVSLEAQITPRTKWLMLNSPCNPSGATYGEAALRELTDVLERHPHVWLLSDDIYEHIVYEPENYAHPLHVCPALRERTLLVNGVSKAYAMTGWRIGYGAGPGELIKAMIAVQGHSTSGASSISQAAALAALEGPQDFIAPRREAFRKRRDLVVGMLNEAEGIDCLVPQGAFYVLPSCAGTIGKRAGNGPLIESDVEFCQHVLDSVGVAVVPGSDFNAPNHFRISYAYDETALAEACRRIQQVCEALK
jgi:aspartate aminotransferase